MIARGRDATAARALAEEFVSDVRSFSEAGRAGQLSPELVRALDMGVEVEGQLHASVGDVDGTLSTLEQAYRERAGARNLLSIGINPLYDFLRGDPRLAEMIERVGL